MRLNTHDRTPRPKSSKIVLFLLILCGILIYGMFCLLAFVCVVDGKSLIAGILVILIPAVLTAIVLIQNKDMDSAYVEINGNSICVVDYCFGIKIEKHFTFSDITSAEIVPAYSFRVKGYRYSIAGTCYIIFKNGKKYLFKIICLPETEKVFGRCINSHAL